MDVEKINSAILVEDFPPTKKMAELEVGVYYSVTEIKMVSTKFGPSTLVSLDNEFNVFLPKRISKILHEETDQFNAFNTAVAEKRLYLRYIGGQYNNCAFSYNKPQ